MFMYTCIVCEQEVGRKCSGNAAQPKMDFKVQSCFICIGTAGTMQAGVSLGSIYKDKSGTTGYRTATRNPFRASFSTFILPVIQSFKSINSPDLF